MKQQMDFECRRAPHVIVHHDATDIAFCDMISLVVPFRTCQGRQLLQRSSIHLERSIGRLGRS